VPSAELVIDARWEQLHRSVSRGIETGDQSPAGVGLGLNLDECRSFAPASPFGALVSETARRLGVEPRTLAVRTLLHLPRVASYEGWVRRSQAQRELRISAERLHSDARAARTHLPVKKFSLTELTFEVIDRSRALPILMWLHYLRSARPDSMYFALVDPIDRLPVSHCSVSPLEWKCVASQIWTQFAIRPETCPPLTSTRMVVTQRLDNYVKDTALQGLLSCKPNTPEDSSKAESNCWIQ
jgi:hypothetical protein